MGWEDFASDAQAADHPRGPRCSVGKTLDGLSSTSRAVVESALNTPGVSNVALHRAFRDRVADRAPSAWSIGHHRRKKCRCGR